MASWRETSQQRKQRARGQGLDGLESHPRAKRGEVRFPLWQSFRAIATTVAGRVRLRA
jgi:hypothetical protein